MKKLVLFVSVILSLISTSVMAYISMATPIGPWIGTTLVLFATIIFGLVRSIGLSKSYNSSTVVYATFAGSVGGIMATAIGFSFPTIYFLDPVLFLSWMHRPWYFVSLLGGLTFVAGWFGLWLADQFEHSLIKEQQLSFPIGQLIYKMIVACNQLRRAYEMVIGFFSSILMCILQYGLTIGRFAIQPFIAKSLVLVQGYNFNGFILPTLRFDLWPLVWAIGFITGHMIMIPLVVGAFSKYCIVNPLNTFFFSRISSSNDFLLAFASGMVLISAVMGMIKTPKVLWGQRKRWKRVMGKKHFDFKKYMNLETLLMIISLSAFFSFFGFSFVQQLYLFVGTVICAYQISFIAGKIGLAQLGRFATFVMVPAMMLFKLSYLQIVLIATFVELSSGVAVDVLFGRKTGSLARISRKDLRGYQFFGIIVSSLTIGCVVWLLASQFGLGSQELFVQRSYARALLIQSGSVDITVLVVGCIFGYLLFLVRLNPMLVLSGLLMPLPLTIGLVTGGFLALLTKRRDTWYPFWSGVFTGNSLWMIVRAFF